MISIRVKSLVLAFALASCGRSGNPTGQVLARVNGEDVTEAQLQVSQEGAPSGASSAAQAGALSALINDTLLAQAAVSEGLDKNPRISRRLEATRRSLLATAYVQSKTLEAAVTPSGVQDYYRTHSVMFGERRRYKFDDVALAGDAATRAKAIAIFNKLDRSVSTLPASLRAAGLSPHLDTQEVTADKLPEQLANSLAKLKVDDSFTFQIGNVVHMSKIAAIALDPVDMASCQLVIAQLLQRQQLTSTAEREVEALKAKGNIRLGDVGNKIMAATPTNVASDDSQ